MKRRGIIQAGMAALCLGAAAGARALTIEGSVSSDSLWTEADSPVIVTGELRIENNAVLEIGPGVVVKVHPARAFIVREGALRALGTADKPVVFTSIADDAADGVDSNGDGAASLPAKDGWGGLRFENGTLDASTVLEHVKVRFGASVILRDARPAFRQLAVTDNAGDAFLLYDNSMIVDGSGLSASGNDKNGIQVAGVLTEASTWSVRDLPYFVGGGSTFEVGQGALGGNLTILPGVTVKQWHGGSSQSYLYVTVRSTLTAIGTALSPIVFTSWADDSVLGDGWPAGPAGPGPGDWRGIYLDGKVALEHAEVRYGGSPVWDPEDAALNVSGDNVVLRHVTVAESGNMGIRFLGGNPLVQDGSVVNSRRVGLWLRTPGSPRVERNRVENNAGGGIQGDVQAGLVVKDNEFVRNGGYAVNLPADGLEFTGNVLDGNQEGSRFVGPGSPLWSGNVYRNTTGNEMVRITPDVDLRDPVPNVFGPGNKVNGIYVDGVVSGSSTWAVNNVPYVMGPGYSVAVGQGTQPGHLTIMPGVVLKFWHGGDSRGIFQVAPVGSLMAVGTSSKPIVFTSLRDNSALGDSWPADDGAPARGDWRGVYLYGAVRLEHAEVRYGGTTIWDPEDAALNPQGDNVTIRHVVVTDCLGGGIRVLDGSPEIQDSRMANISGYAVYLRGSGRALLERNRIEDNGGGINGIDPRTGTVAGAVIKNNEFWRNLGYAAYLPTADLDFTGNVLDGNQEGSRFVGPGSPLWSGNVYRNTTGNEMVRITPDVDLRDPVPNVFGPGNKVNGIYVDGVVSGSSTWAVNNVPYVMGPGYSVAVGQGTQPGHLTIMPGVALKFWHGGDSRGIFQVAPVGSLTAVGTSSKPIVFTSLRDNSALGDSWPADDGAPARGDWRGIYLYGKVTLEHVEVRYGAANIWDAEEGAVTTNSNDALFSDVAVTESKIAAVRVLSGSPIIKDSQFIGGTYGMLVMDATPVVENVEFKNQMYGLHSRANTPFTIGQSRFEANTEYGIYNGNPVVVLQAQNNWWGDPTGPSHPTLNPEGRGQRVTDGVAFSPWKGGIDIANPRISIEESTATALAVNLVLSVDGGETMRLGNGLPLTGPSEPFAARRIWTLPPGDGIKTIFAQFYAGDGSSSDIVSATVTLEMAPPSAAIALSPAPPYAAGAARVTLTASEPLAAVPSLQFTPPGKSPIAIPLSSTDSLVFTGEIVVSSATGDGLAAFGFSAVDLFGKTGTVLTSGATFLIDTTPPPAPVVFPVPAVVTNPNVTFSGTKAAESSLWFNGAQVVGLNNLTTWTHDVRLSSGANIFSVTAQDALGNTSTAASVRVVFDDIAPAPVATLVVRPEGPGTTLDLDWSGYDEAGQGDIHHYEVYVQEALFSSVAGLTPVATRGRGVFTYTAAGLARGGTYFCAVVAVDDLGNFKPDVAPVSAAPRDTVAPPAPGGLAVESFDDRLVFRWQAPAADDVAGYRVSFNDGAALPRAAADFEAAGLSPSTAYPFRVTAVDNDGNESAPLTGTGVTLLPNPAGLAANNVGSFLALAWAPVHAAALVKAYNVYADTRPFSSVEGLAPRLSVPTASANLAGLANGATYYIAVTAVNLSGGERREVLAITATPQPDSAGPAISGVSWDGAALSAGQTLTRAGRFSAQAADPSGLALASFLIDGAPICEGVSGGPAYSCDWDVALATDGPHELTVTVQDSLLNSNSVTFPVNVALAPPPAPTLFPPAAEGPVNALVAAVSGQTTARNVEILYFVNGSTAARSDAGPTGAFSAEILLLPGNNLVQAAARNRAGPGPLSAGYEVVVDTSVPNPPLHLAALAKAGGIIGLSWSAPGGPAIRRYHVYRATVPAEGAELPSAAQKISGAGVAGVAFEDAPAEDGTYFYWVTSENLAGTFSAPSRQTSATVDATPPRANVFYSPAGARDPVTGRIGPGQVTVFVQVTEPLLVPPFFSLTPASGLPITLSLAVSTNPLTYKGSFTLAPQTPAGLAHAVFSGRDLAGNRGTAIDAGAAVLLDARGPSLVGIQLTPAAPIANDGATAVTAHLAWDESIPSSGSLTLSYKLSGAGRTAQPIPVPAGIFPASSAVVSFTLPTDAGQHGAETLSFQSNASDDLGNVSDAVFAPNSFEVFRGTLPALGAPFNLSAVSRPAGKIRLSWSAVNGAADYRLFRRAVSETSLAPLALASSLLVSSGSQIVVEDSPVTEGEYIYAVASLRRAGGFESLSSTGTSVGAVSDATPSAAPRNLALLLAGNGVRLSWGAPAPLHEPVTYLVYRGSDTLPSVAGINPLIPPLDKLGGAALRGVDALALVDPSPAKGERFYTITAVDAAGNESLPSVSASLPITVLPVSQFTVSKAVNADPLLVWSHPAPAELSGYNLYLGTVSAATRLNAAPLTSPAYTDSGAAGRARAYALTAVDTNAVESPARLLTLPAVEFQAPISPRLRRGVMNRLVYPIVNRGPAVARARLRLAVAGRTHLSAEFSLPVSPAPVSVPVAVGGYADLPALARVTADLEILPEEGSLARLTRQDDVPVGNGVLTALISDDAFTRGAGGAARFRLENTSDAEIDIVTAHNGGDSPETRFLLKDLEGNVLGAAALRQSVGARLITLSDGRTVARLAPGEAFESASVTVPVPASAPDKVSLVLVVDAVRHNTGKPDEVLMQGFSGAKEVALQETAYAGEITAISPARGWGDGPVLIQGRAVDRAGAAPVSGVRLSLVVGLQGYERKFDVFTSSSGAFAYNYTPGPNEGGVYTVSAIHPDRTDRPGQGTFTVQRVGFSPATINLSAARNYTQTAGITVTAGAGVEAANLRLEMATAPTGVHITLPPARDLPLGGQAPLPFAVWGDNKAPQNSSVALTPVADFPGEPNRVLGAAALNLQLLNAEPALFWTPSVVETGLKQGELASETLTFENRGLADIEGFSVELLDGAGAPAPNWARLSVPADIGTIAPNAKKSITLAFAPTAAVADGIYIFKVRASAANHPPKEIGVSCAVTNSGTGQALFRVLDIYTATLDAGGQPIPGVAGAQIKLQNEAVPTVAFTMNTDGLGEALFTDVPVGTYLVRVSSANHQDAGVRLWVKPGVTAVDEVFLNSDLVTVEWSVVPTTIQDRYEIVLSANFVTDVPAAVVVANPPSVTLPEMSPGDVFTGEITLTNHGLIQAEEVSFSLPPEDEFFRYELLTPPPSVIAAKAAISVQYRVTSLKSLNQTGEGTGAGGGGYGSGGQVGFSFIAACGVKTTGSSSFVFTGGPWSSPTPDINFNFGTPSTGGTSNGGGGGGGGQGNTTPITPGAMPMPGGGPCADNENCGETQCCDGDRKQETESDVDLVFGRYFDRAMDMDVVVPGGRIEVSRIYAGTKWIFNHLRKSKKNFGTTRSGPKEVRYVKSIEWDGQTYANGDPLSSTPVFVNQNGRFETEGDAPREGADPAGAATFYDGYGNWSQFDASGNMIAFGNHTGVLGRYMFADGLMVGIQDRHGRQVLWFEYTGERFSAVRDLAGRRVRYEFENEIPDIAFHYTNFLTAVTGMNGEVTTYSYEGIFLNKKVLPNGKAVNIHYSFLPGQWTYVSKVVSPRGATLFDFKWDTNVFKRYTHVKLADGHEIERWFDLNNRMVLRRDNGVETAAITWSKDYGTKTTVDERGGTTVETFDTHRRLTGRTRPDGAKESWAYDGFGNLLETTDRHGTVTKYEYAGRLLITVREGLGTPSQRVTAFEHDADGNVVKQTVDGKVVYTGIYDPATGLRTEETDGDGNRTEYAYDEWGNLKERRVKGKTGPDGVWTYTHDKFRRPLTVLDPTGRLVTNNYDVDGNLKRTEATGLAPRALTYDLWHNALTEGVEDGGTVKNLFTRTYDGMGRLTKERDGLGNEQTLEYDLFGRLSKTTDAQGHVTRYFYGQSACGSCAGAGIDLLMEVEYPTFRQTFTYDAVGRKTGEATREPGGKIISARTFSYDANGNLLLQTDGNGNATAYEYDLLNRLTASVDAKGTRTAYTYDGRDNLLTLTDGENNTTRFQYNGNNQVIEETRPLGQKTTYAYNELGNLAVKVDAKGQKTEYGYDLAGRLTSTKFYLAGSSAPVKSVEYTHDAAGTLSGYNDANTSAIYAYDNQGRKKDETVNYGSFTLGYGYTYDIMGNKKTMTYPNGTTYSFTYNPNNQLATYQIPGQGVISYQYHWTRPSRVVYPGGVTRTVDYDPAMRTKRIKVTDPGENVLMDYQYTYDAADNITTKETEHGKYEYGYDPTYQLTQAISPKPGTSGFDNTLEGFTYDQVGNRIKKQNDLLMSTASYNGNNELEQTTDAIYEHDANGNLTKKVAGGVTTTYIYDVENRLVQVSDTSGLRAEYQYDPFGRRLTKTVTTSSGTTREHFYYGDEGLIAEATGAGVITKTYGWQPDGVWGTDPVLMNVTASAGEANGYHWYLNDHLATPQKMVATSGAVSWSAIYEGFGKATVDAATVTNNLRFPGQYADKETGLHYNWHRYFDPVRGFYITEDPVKFDGGSINLHNYVFSNPANHFDPLGLYSWLSFLYDASNTSAGFGDYVSFGITKYIRKGFGYDNVVDPCSGFYQAGKYTGIAYDFVWAGVGSLSAGSKTVFYSGRGSLRIARRHKGVGIMLEETFGGRALNVAQELVRRLGGEGLPDVVWEGASAIYAANAKGVAQAFIRNGRRNSIFRTIEKPIVRKLNNARIAYR